MVISPDLLGKPEILALTSLYLIKSSLKQVDVRPPLSFQEEVTETPRKPPSPHLLKHHHC